MTLSSSVFHVVGFSGISFFVIALMPQIYRAHKLKSVEDISSALQIQALMATIMYLMYFVHFDMWAVVPPTIAEIGALAYLIFLKIYYRRAAAKRVKDQLDSLGNILLPEDDTSETSGMEEGG